MKNLQYPSLAVALFSCALVVDVKADSLALPQYPLQTTGFVEPNVMFLIDNSGSMNTVDSGTSDTRLTIAKQVANDIIKDTPDVRFCLGKFNHNNGGQVVTECQLPTLMPSSTETYIENAINALTGSTWTPLAEAYYEMVGYFRDGKSIYNTDTPGRISPIQYRCQKNFAIVLTDGVPYFDSSFPGLDALAPNHTVVYGDYDGVANDGDLSNGDYYKRYLFLDDIAKFAYETDLRTTGTDLAGKSYNDILFPVQNLITYTVGFTLNDANALAMLQDAAEKDGYGHGKYYQADTSDELQESFGKALTKITDTSQSVATASANTSELIAGAKLYQSRYTAADWTGELIALQIDETTAQASSTPLWSGPVNLNLSQRVIYTGHNNGSLFEIASFSSAEITSWFDGDSAMIDYLRGNADANYRTRALTMGDIINSTPVYVDGPEADVYDDDDFGPDYSDFYNTHKNRQPMIYLGANDGMLHGFDADTGEEKLAFVPSLVIPYLKELADVDYNHRFYVDGSPAVKTVFSNDKWLTLLVGGFGRGGQGLYALDVTDPNFAKTNTDAVATLQWEFSDSDDADLGFTYSAPQIMRLNDGNFYVVLANGYNNTTASETGDTHLSTTGNAVLYLLNVTTGAIVKKLSTGVGMADPSNNSQANGLAAPAGLDTNKDGKMDYVYAGDLFGNLWRFDLSSADPSNWGADGDANTDNNPLLLFTAKDASDNVQPITARVEVAKLPNDQLMIYFGTGKYLEAVDTDAANISLQSFYAIQDNGQLVSGRSALLEQSIVYHGDIEFTPTGGDTVSREVRLTSNNNYSGSEKGWYMDLHKPTYGNDDVVTDVQNSVVYVETGEQIIVSAIYRDSYDGTMARNEGRIFFVTDQPNNVDQCLPSSKNYLMSLDAETGARLNFISIDINGDNEIDVNDGVDTGTTDAFGNKISASTSGFQISSRQTPTFYKATDDEGKKTGREYMLISNASVSKDGTGEYADTVAVDAFPAATPGKRTSWREIRAD